MLWRHWKKITITNKVNLWMYNLFDVVSRLKRTAYIYITPLIKINQATVKGFCLSCFRINFVKLFRNICEWLLFFVIRSVFDNTNKNFNGKPWIVYAAIKRRSKWFCKIYIFFDLRWVFNSKPLFESNSSHSYETVITRKASLSNKSIDKIWNKCILIIPDHKELWSL